MSVTQNSKILANDVKGAIKGITRSGTTFTYTCLDGTSGSVTTTGATGAIRNWNGTIFSGTVSWYACGY